MYINLLKPIYGEASVPIQFMRTLKKHLVEPTTMMEQSLVDPCLYIKQNKKSKVTLMVVTYVDGILLAETRSNIE